MIEGANHPRFNVHYPLITHNRIFGGPKPLFEPDLVIISKLQVENTEIFESSSSQFLSKDHYRLVVYLRRNYIFVS
jgi:hypothetical protein